jgi:hypothetical protein
VDNHVADRKPASIGTAKPGVIAESDFKAWVFGNPYKL